MIGHFVYAVLSKTEDELNNNKKQTTWLLAFNGLEKRES